MASVHSGSRLGPFLLDNLVHEGDSGVVYQGCDREQDRPVAIRLVRPRRDASEWRERFVEHMARASKVAQPNVTAIRGYGIQDGTAYAAWEWVDGATIEERLLEAGQLGPLAAARIAEGVAQALVACHSEGIVHGELASSKIMMDPRGVVKVLDAGLGTFLASPASPPRRAGATARAEDLVALGELIQSMIGGRRGLKDVRSLTRHAGNDLERGLPPALKRIQKRLLESSGDGDGYAEAEEAAADLKDCILMLATALRKEAADPTPIAAMPRPVAPTPVEVAPTATLAAATVQEPARDVAMVSAATQPTAPPEPPRIEGGGVGDVILLVFGVLLLGALGAAAFTLTGVV